MLKVWIFLALAGGLVVGGWYAYDRAWQRGFDACALAQAAAQAAQRELDAARLDEIEALRARRNKVLVKSIEVIRETKSPCLDQPLEPGIVGVLKSAGVRGP